MQVNRSLKNKAMDHIDHALGRPLDPIGETYRNHFAAGPADAKEMAASPYWDAAEKHSRMQFFYVNDAGRRALAAHLREIGDQHRAFVVTFDGHPHTIVATSAAKAKYSWFLDLSDSFQELTFKAFCRRSRVRLAQPSGGHTHAAP